MDAFQIATSWPPIDAISDILLMRQTPVIHHLADAAGDGSVSIALRSQGLRTVEGLVMISAAARAADCE